MTRSATRIVLALMWILACCLLVCPMAWANPTSEGTNDVIPAKGALSEIPVAGGDDAGHTPNSDGAQTPAPEANTVADPQQPAQNPPKTEPAPTTEIPSESGTPQEPTPSQAPSGTTTQNPSPTPSTTPPVEPKPIEGTNPPANPTPSPASESGQEPLSDTANESNADKNPLETQPPTTIPYQNQEPAASPETQPPAAPEQDSKPATSPEPSGNNATILQEQATFKAAAFQAAPAATPAPSQEPPQKAAAPAPAAKPAATSKPATPAKTGAAKAPVKTTSKAATAKQLVANGVYWIESASNLRLILDMSGANKAAGGNAIVWDFNGGANQKWRLTYDAKSGCYFITNVNSGKVLDVAGARAASGTNVLQWSKKSGAAANQLWRISYDARTGYQFTSALRSNLVLSVQGSRASKGGNVQVSNASKSAVQRWWLIPANPSVKAARTVETGVYTIARADAKNQLVDVAGVSQTPGANVGLWQANGGANQKWVIVRGADNFYSIVSVSSGQALDVEGACITANTNVLQWNQKSSTNQKWAIQKNADGTFSFISKMNGMALSTTGTKNGANVRTYLANGATHEKFVLKATPLITEGVYTVSPRSNTAVVADVPGYSMKNGTALALWSYNGGLNQKVQVKHLGNDVYTIQVGHTGQMLADSGGKAVQAARNGSSKAQRWKAQWKSTGIQFVNAGTGRALNVGGAAKSDTALRTAKASSAGSQRFMLTKRNVLDDGMYTFRTYAGSRVVDIEGASTANGANAELWKANGGNNQKFQVTAVGGGYYKIVSVKSGKALDVAGASKASGANVLQWAYKGSANQLWKPELSPNGGIVFVSKNGGKVLNVAGGADRQGANVNVANRTDANGQRWYPETTARKIEDPALERALAIAKQKYSSTNYLITVDLSNHRTIVFQRSGSGWQAVKNWTCTTGAPSTPTVRGDYTVGMRGYSFGSGYTCYYWTQFYGDYLFHSVLYHEGTRSVLDGRLGQSLSHGCVRLDINNAQWIYNTIPSGTKVTTYY